MTIYHLSVNNEAKTLESETNVAQALELWGYNCEKIAIAINGDFVPRSTYQQTYFNEGDCVDVLAPVQGG